MPQTVNAVCVSAAAVKTDRRADTRVSADSFISFTHIHTFFLNLVFNLYSQKNMDRHTHSAGGCP